MKSLCIWLTALFSVFPFSNGATKIWNTKGHGQNYRAIGTDKACAEHTLVYTMLASVEVHVPTNRWLVERIVLPTEGAIIINDSHPITLHTLAASVCSERSKHFKDFMLIEEHMESWFSSKMWLTDGELEPNKAVPTINRVPCECDEVVFPEHESLSVAVHDASDISVASVKINGRHGNFKEFLKTELGEMLFFVENPNDINADVGMCKPPKFCGCHNYHRYRQYMQVVCGVEECEPAHCIDPIKPLGQCCPMCGAAVYVEFDQHLCHGNSSEFKYHFEEMIRNWDDGKYGNLIDLYVGYFPNGSDSVGVMQITVADKGEYNEHSTEFARIHFGSHPGSLISGARHVPGDSAPIFSVIFGSLVLVLSIYGFIYLRYVNPPKVPKWIPTRHRFAGMFASPFVFARFDNTATTGSAEDGDKESVAVGLASFHAANREYQSMASAFDNPLFKGVVDDTGDGDEDGQTGDQVAETKAQDQINEDIVDVGSLVDVDLISHN